MSTSRPRPNLWMLLLRCCLLVSLAASAALTVDYLNPTGAFCAPGSGCDAVRDSSYAMILGRVPVPVLGVIAFAIVFAVSLLPNTRLRWVLLGPLVFAGAAVALLLIALQAFAIGAFCWLCMVTDVAALGAAVALIMDERLRRRTDPAVRTVEALPPWAWAALGAVAVAAPLVWPHIRPRPVVPTAISQFYVAGRVNIVEFADFQCPFCRILHTRMGSVLRDHAGPVNVIRLNAPLPSHPHARDAARAAVCAGRQAKGDEMADMLFETEDLTRPSIRRLAEIVGLDTDLFVSCLTDPATEKRIDSEFAILQDIGFEGLPTVFIGQQKLVGAQPEDVIREAIQTASQEVPRGGIPGYAYLVLIATTVILVVFTGRRSIRS